MASGAPPTPGPPLDAPAPAPGGDGRAWPSTCGYADCVEPSRYAANFKCAGCLCVNYCAPACQKADWKRHKPACRAAAADESVAREPPVHLDPMDLLMAAQEGNLPVVQALLRLGAKVNAPEPGGDAATPLFFAAQGGHAAVVSVLLAARGVAVNAASSDGATPLYVASQNGHAAVVAALLAAPGVDVIEHKVVQREPSARPTRRPSTRSSSAGRRTCPCRWPRRPASTCSR